MSISRFFDFLKFGFQIYSREQGLKAGQICPALYYESAHKTVPNKLFLISARHGSIVYFSSRVSSTVATGCDKNIAQARTRTLSHSMRVALFPEGPKTQGSKSMATSDKLPVKRATLNNFRATLNNFR